MKSKRSQKKGKKGSLMEKTIKVVAIGNLHLKFTLALTNEFLAANSMNFDDIVSHSDLAFLKSNKNLWNDIIVSSNNKSMNMLIQMNKSTKKKFFLEYVIMDQITFTEEQKALKDFVNHVTETNFVFLRESQACPCNVDIILYLSNGPKVKSFKLCESKNLAVGSSKEKKDEEEEKKEEEKEQQQTKETTDKKEDANQEIEAKEPQIETNPQPPKAQSPPEDSTQQQENENEKAKGSDKDPKAEEDNNPFAKITEISFNDFNYLFIDLADFTQTELATSVKMTDIMKFIQYLKINTKIDIITSFPNLISSTLTTEEMTAIDQLLLLTDIYLFERKEAYHVFNVLHLYTTQEQNPKDLDKKKDIEYFINDVCYQCPIKYKKKIGIFMDDFSKVVIVSVSQNSKPSINEYDALIYPKINHHNMKIVDEYKSIVNQNYVEYSAIFFGAFIGKLVQGELSEREIYISYLIGIESTKKILELNKNGLDLPKNKDFYLVKLPSDKIDQNLQGQLLRQKENKFVLDCVNEQRSRLRYYNPLFDFHLHTYFSSQVNRKELKTKGFINTKGFIMYDAVYREMLGSSPKKKRNEEIDEAILLNTIHEIKVGEKVTNKELNSKEEIKKKNSPLQRKLPVNYPERNSLYSRSKQLPPIKSKH